MLKATSKFGAQMDSLADIVNFGVAPALVLYAFLLDRAGSPGWIAALLFAIACGLRLARFNVLDEDLERPAWQAEYFVGVPAPAGAVLVLLPVYIGFMGVEPERPLVYASHRLHRAGRAPAGQPAAGLFRQDHPPARLDRQGDAADLRRWCSTCCCCTYPWQTLSASVLAYLIFLPLSARAYARRARLEAAKAEARGGAPDG